MYAIVPRGQRTGMGTYRRDKGPSNFVLSLITNCKILFNSLGIGVCMCKKRYNDYLIKLTEFNMCKGISFYVNLFWKFKIIYMKMGHVLISTRRMQPVLKGTQFFHFLFSEPWRQAELALTTASVTFHSDC